MTSKFRPEVCEADHHDEQKEAEILSRIPDEDSAVDAADLFSQLSDSTRVRLLSMLSVSDICVCEMSDMLNMSQPAVSHHLRNLRQCGIVRFKKQGKRASYYLDPENGETVRKLLQAVFERTGEND